MLTYNKNSHANHDLSRSSKMMLVLASLGALFAECSASKSNLQLQARLKEAEQTAWDRMKAIQAADKKRMQKLLGKDFLDSSSEDKSGPKSKECGICHETDCEFYDNCKRCTYNVCKDCVIRNCDKNECPFCKSQHDFYSELSIRDKLSKPKITLTCPGCGLPTTMNTAILCETLDYGGGINCGHCCMGFNVHEREDIPKWFADAHDHYSEWLPIQLEEMEKYSPSVFKGFQKRIFHYEEDRIDYFEGTEKKGCILRKNMQSVEPNAKAEDQLVIRAFDPKRKNKIRDYSFRVPAEKRDMAVEKLRDYMNDAAEE